MYFKLLPEHIKEAIVKLTKDDVFQQRFATDEELDKIEAMKINYQEEALMIEAILNNSIVINNIEIPLLTPAKWAYLWTLRSPIVYENEKISYLDIDIFTYILFKGTSHRKTDLITNAAGFCQSINLDYETAIAIIKKIIQISFRPLNLFPEIGDGGGQLIFDADWLTLTVARVHNVTGYTPEYILHNLSLSAVCYYFAQYSRINGVKNIYRRTDEEVLILQMERSVDLICDRLIELNVFSPSERLKYRMIMLTPPDSVKTGK